MSQKSIRKLLEDVAAGGVSIPEAIKRLRMQPFYELPFARIDVHRSIRCGFPEVIYSEGKTAEQVGRIAATILEHGDQLLATRASPDAYESIRAVADDAQYHADARCVTVDRRGDDAPEATGLILVIGAGTSDIPVAEEARITAAIMDGKVETIYDAGVAGIHRLLHETERILDANVIVVVAGMEGALASVVGGLVDVPVVAVPTSTGYGASFGGVAPLLTMLNSCAAGVSVVNIDNGFGAGYIAALINRGNNKD